MAIAIQEYAIGLFADGLASRESRIFLRNAIAYLHTRGLGLSPCCSLARSIDRSMVINAYLFECIRKRMFCMCVCVCMCVYVCVSVCMYVCVSVCMYVCMY